MFGWQPSYRFTVANYSLVKSFGKLPQRPVSYHHLTLNTTFIYTGAPIETQSYLQRAMLCVCDTQIWFNIIQICCAKFWSLKSWICWTSWTLLNVSRAPHVYSPVHCLSTIQSFTPNACLVLFWYVHPLSPEQHSAVRFGITVNTH